MAGERLKGWLEVIGMAAIIASLAFVGLQMRQDQSIAIADTYGSVASTALQLAELIDGHGELWRKGLDGEKLSLDEQIEFYSLANAVEASFVLNWNRSIRLGAASPKAQLRDYAIALHSHVGLRQWFETKIDRFTQTDAAFDVPLELGAFESAIVEQLEYLATNGVPVPETKAYVFWD